eukprot:COSAG02_NODE_22212_length_760_cov_0.444781_2_plen_86_part_00
MFSFGNGKYEEAAELYGQAAKQYQLGKNCESPPGLRTMHETESTASRPSTIALRPATSVFKPKLHRMVRVSNTDCTKLEIKSCGA